MVLDILLDILFLLILSIFLIILYRRNVQNRNLNFGVLKDRYFEINRNNRIKTYIKSVNIRPEDKQKIIFGDILILIIIVSIMYVLISKSIFFAVVVSESMTPTFDKYDLILSQNIYRDYNVGDIVTFKSPDTSTLTTHRIVRIESGDDIIIRTAGDATRQTDWWELKKDNIIGKVISIQEKPIVIKKLGMYFIAENSNQRFGPYDYRTLFLIFEIVKLYGYIIAIISISAYIIIESNRVKKVKELEKMKKYNPRKY